MRTNEGEQSPRTTILQLLGLNPCVYAEETSTLCAWGGQGLLLVPVVLLGQSIADNKLC